MKRHIKRLLVTDLDNTLWNWVAIWYEPFAAMIDEVLVKGEVEREVLLDEIRDVHRRFGTSEYAFLLEELPSLRRNRSREQVVRHYAEAIEVYRERRRGVLAAYATVTDTLERVKAAGALVVAYTESLAYYSEYRLRRTGIDRFLDALYSPADHDLPAARETLRKYPAEEYGLPVPHRHTPRGQTKPSPSILLDILRSVNVRAEDAIYVGDSIPKDIGMAQCAAVLDVHAAYGMVQHTAAYQLLRRVSHWTDEEIEREKKNIAAPPHAPSIVLGNTFAELLDHIEFTLP